MLFAVIYLFVDFALNRFAFSDGWTIIWPLNGINVALLLMRPRSAWPFMLLGIEIGTGLGECLEDSHNAILMQVSQRLISGVEVVTSALLLPPFVTLDRWLRTPRIFYRFAAALVLGPGISGALAACLFHVVQGQPLLLAFNNWATADALGIAATMPLALSLGSPQLRRLFERRALPRTLGSLTLALVGAGIIFSVSDYPLVFLLFPLLLLVEATLAFAGSAIAIVGVCLISVYCTTLGLGPFGKWPANLAVPRDLALQLYFGFHLIALFPASLMFMERRRMAGDLRDKNARLTVLASLDGLTGIANRRCFDERFAQEWNRAIRHHKPIALAMIDLDNFKQFNDLYGHLAGDRCLCAVADALSRQVQRPEDLVARFGGEEFTLLLPAHVRRRRRASRRAHSQGHRGTRDRSHRQSLELRDSFDRLLGRRPDGQRRSIRTDPARRCCAVHGEKPRPQSNRTLVLDRRIECHRRGQQHRPGIASPACSAARTASFSHKTSDTGIEARVATSQNGVMTLQPSTRERGLAAEARAAAFLERCGLEILSRNLRCRVGELDLVCLDGEILVIVEVRQRARVDFGGALGSVTARKQRRVVRAAAYCYQQTRAWRERVMRFDVVALQNDHGTESIEWIRDAFR